MMTVNTFAIKQENFLLDHVANYEFLNLTASVLSQMQSMYSPPDQEGELFTAGKEWSTYLFFTCTKVRTFYEM